jgi:hypothetical protein
MANSNQPKDPKTGQYISELTKFNNELRTTMTYILLFLKILVKYFMKMKV